MDTIVGVSLLGVLLAISISILIAHYWSRNTTLASGLPWVDLRDEVFRTTRASLRHLTNSSKILQDGYSKYGKKGQPFFVSDASFQPQIMLPQEYIKWLTTQSETVLSIWPVRSKRRAMEAMIDSVDHKSTFIFMDKIISRFLTRNLGAGQAAVADEIAASVDDTMGLDEDAWCDVNLAQTFKEIGDRSGVRALFGFALCRDRHFLRILNRYKTLMGVGIFMSGQLPPPIRPIVSLLLVLPFRFSKTRVTRVLTPIVKERMREAACEQVDSTLENQAHDLLTQSIRTIMNEKSNTHRNNADYIADEFLVLSFASLASIALVAGNLFLDILSTPNAYARLRAEAADVFTSAADWADPAVLKKLILTDSAIRESLRRSSIQTRGLLREVVAKDGVNLPDGTHVARGTWLGVPVEAVHMDDKFYDRPEEYNPWRFARMSSEDVVGGDKVEATEVNEKFLGWSYGKHACPGRWFAVRSLKVMIAYITLNYDIEPIDKQPACTVIGDAKVPSFSYCIKVRRRKRE